MTSCVYVSLGADHYQRYNIRHETPRPAAAAVIGLLKNYLFPKTFFLVCCDSSLLCSLCPATALSISVLPGREGGEEERGAQSDYILSRFGRSSNLINRTE